MPTRAELRALLMSLFNVEELHQFLRIDLEALQLNELPSRLLPKETYVGEVVTLLERHGAIDEDLALALIARRPGREREIRLHFQLDARPPSGADVEVTEEDRLHGTLLEYLSRRKLLRLEAQLGIHGDSVPSHRTERVIATSRAKGILSTLAAPTSLVLDSATLTMSYLCPSVPNDPDIDPHDPRAALGATLWLGAGRTPADGGLDSAGAPEILMIGTFNNLLFSSTVARGADHTTSGIDAVDSTIAAFQRTMEGDYRFTIGRTIEALRDRLWLAFQETYPLTDAQPGASQDQRAHELFEFIRATRAACARKASLLNMGIRSGQTQRARFLAVTYETYPATSQRPALWIGSPVFLGRTS